MNKNYIIWVIIIVLVGGSLLYFNNKSTNPSPTPYGTQNQNADTTKTQSSNNSTYGTVLPPPKSTTLGRVVFTITDDAVSLDTLQSIMLTVNKVTVQKPGGSSVTVLNGPRQFDLLDLYRNPRVETFSDINLDPGTYNQISIYIGKIMVVPKGGVNGVEAKIPSNELRLNNKIAVE